MYGFKALILDVDGTLADTECDGHRRAFNAAFAETGLGWEWSVELYGELLRVAGGKERIGYFLDRWRPTFRPPKDRDDFIADLHRRKTRYYQHMLRDGAIPLRTGVVRLLRQARESGVRLAIATTTAPKNVTSLLESCREPGLAGWFEVIAAGDVVPAKKPAPDIYLWALEQLGLPACSCVAVEDSDLGVRSARGAGIEALLVTLNPYTRNQDVAGAALVVDKLGDPGVPARVFRGSLGVSDQVDLAVLDAMHRRVYGGAER